MKYSEFIKKEELSIQDLIELNVMEEKEIEVRENHPSKRALLKSKLDGKPPKRGIAFRLKERTKAYYIPEIKSIAYDFNKKLLDVCYLDPIRSYRIEDKRLNTHNSEDKESKKENKKIKKKLFLIKESKYEKGDEAGLLEPEKNQVRLGSTLFHTVPYINERYMMNIRINETEDVEIIVFRLNNKELATIPKYRSASPHELKILNKIRKDEK